MYFCQPCRRRTNMGIKLGNANGTESKRKSYETYDVSHIIITQEE